jgi:HD-like signal output (HDOD) protein
MKKQICFAGFSEEELALLQPSLAAVAGAWDCVFAPDAASTLAALARTPFDVLVANLSAGGIHDAEFLEQAARQHPRTLRFVLGDVSDRDLMVHCMGTAHQFISRPWKPQDLVSILERSLALDAWLTNDKLRSFVPRLGKLPGLPASYFEVIKTAESPNASVESIAEVIARDPALTARLLQMVNSPACGLAEKITNPREAVSMLGIETVKSLVLCLQLFAQAAPVEGASLSLDQLWRHSFNVAKLAARVVLRCIGSERMASDAYTAGLLHNIGQIVLATNLAREYSVVVETARNLKCPLQEAELKLMGVTRHQIGAYLLGLWGMPLPLLESTALHDTPSLTKAVEFSVLTAVHVANVLASEQTGRIEGLLPPKLDAEYLATLELPNRPEAWRKFLDTAPKHVEVVDKPAEDAEDAENRASSSAPARKKAARPGGKFLVLAGIAATIVVAVMLTRNEAPAAPKAAPASGQVAAPAPGAPVMARGTEATKAPPDESAFDSIKIQGIVYHAGHSIALINGKSLDVGDRINGVEVVSIEPSNVVLACNGVKKKFLLK